MTCPKCNGTLWVCEAHGNPYPCCDPWQACECNPEGRDLDLSKDTGIERVHGWPEFEPPLPADTGAIMAMDLFAERLTVMCENGPYQLVAGEWQKLGS